MSEFRTVKLQQACMSIRHKLMYVDSRQTTPGLVDDSSETRFFFCMKTQDPLGPDNEPVNPKDCTEARACYCKG